MSKKNGSAMFETLFCVTEGTSEDTTCSGLTHFSESLFR
jgi:hypothetical protein